MPPSKDSCAPTADSAPTTRSELSIGCSTTEPRNPKTPGASSPLKHGNQPEHPRHGRQA